jgi:phthiocerol/phenolphthiocerol synthesis type-I polyketide synthase E
VTGKAAGVADERRPTTDVDAVRSRLAAAGAVPGKPKGRSAFILGPRWHNMANQWAAGDEKLIEVALAPAFRGDLAEHAMHPALLDTVTAGVRRPGQESTVPLLYRRLVAYEALPAEFFAHVRRDPGTADDVAAGDIDLVAADGTMLVSVEGFTMRQVDLVDFKPAAPPAEPAPAAKSDVDGLDPVRGVELLLRMLSANLAGVVLVRPYRDGRPVPLPTSGRREHTAPPAAQPPAVQPPVAQASVAATPSPGRTALAVVPAPSPAADLRSRLRELWISALGVSEVDDEHDFFDAGGNSLTAIDIMAQVRESFGIELSIGLLLQARTFGRLVAALRENGATG